MVIKRMRGWLFRRQKPIERRFARRQAIDLPDNYGDRRTLTVATRQSNGVKAM